jgi:hypothetical protein
MLINLSIDFGGSGTKAICSTDENVWGFRLAPEIIEMTGEPPQLNDEFTIDLSQNMWVGGAEKRYAVGLLARRDYLASIPLVAPKTDYVIPRTMAALAAAMDRFKVGVCDVRLQLLFPSSEFERMDLTRLVRELKTALAGFDSPMGRLKAKLKTCSIKPEGWGLTRRYMSLVAAEQQTAQIACIMFGHRNTSLYLCSGGHPRHYRSNDKGFVRAIEYAKLDPLDGLHNPGRVDQQSIDKYWLGNKNWISENLPPTTSIAIIGGGPLAVIGDRVGEFLDSFLPPQPVRRTSYGSDRDKSAISNGGMPIAASAEGAWKEIDLLQSWPKSIDLSESDRRQFCDVYCLWATNEMTKRAAILA